MAVCEPDTTWGWPEGMTTPFKDLGTPPKTFVGAGALLS